MKRCVIYANCQGCLGVFRILKSLPAFSSIYSLEYEHNYINKEYKVPEDCKLLIYQPVSWFTPPPDVQSISFPYIYDDGTFPVHGGTGGFKIIDDLLKQGKNVLEMYDNGEIDFKLAERKKKSLEILKEKEKLCTIKISDYLEYTTNRPLFFMQSHPTMFVFCEIVNRIFEHLKLPPISWQPICWCGGLHLDYIGICHHPYSKELSYEKKSILPLDSYSLVNQKTIFNAETNQWEDFYVVDNSMVRKMIEDHLAKPPI
jgi:hypothetical protein